jgi:hypothetical protein
MTSALVNSCRNRLGRRNLHDKPGSLPNLDGLILLKPSCAPHRIFVAGASDEPRDFVDPTFLI